MNDQQTNVAVKIQSLLDRVAALTTADKLKSKRFDAKGQAAARAIAAADGAGMTQLHQPTLSSGADALTFSEGPTRLNPLPQNDLGSLVSS